MRACLLQCCNLFSFPNRQLSLFRTVALNQPDKHITFPNYPPNIYQYLFCFSSFRQSSIIQIRRAGPKPDLRQRLHFIACISHASCFFLLCLPAQKCIALPPPSENRLEPNGSERTKDKEEEWNNKMKKWQDIEEVLAAPNTA